ncbi:MAG: SMI1/KNR4 family protein [Bacillota bacterium]|nr:SMI1/KNR4 family protein [Bacillota bacterium]
MEKLDKMSIPELWEYILEIYDKQYSGYSSNLNPSAKNEDFADIEEKMGFALPDELKALYFCNNGDRENLEGSILGLRFLPVAEMFLNWCDWLYILRDKEFMKACEANSESVPQGAIKKVYANRKWVPFCHDQEGNHIGIDLDPDSDGTVGQIINFGRDEDKKYVIANSFKEFMILIINILDKKKPIIKTKRRRIYVSLDDCHPIRLFTSNRIDI